MFGLQLPLVELLLPLLNLFLLLFGLLIFVCGLFLEFDENKRDVVMGFASGTGWQAADVGLTQTHAFCDSLK
jgi:hypothetical protein